VPNGLSHCTHPQTRKKRVFTADRRKICALRGCRREFSARLSLVRCVLGAPRQEATPMLPIKTILVPTDFSECSTEATRAAIEFAKQFHASLEIVYVFEPVQYSVPEAYLVYPPAGMATVYAELRRALAKVQKIAFDAGISNTSTMLLEGYVADTIVERAATINAELIVIGTHGRHGIAHALLGSVAEKVVRKAGCPVLTVRCKKPAKKD
jgi:universal stress protein A